MNKKFKRSISANASTTNWGKSLTSAMISKMISDWTYDYMTTDKITKKVLVITKDSVEWQNG